MNASSGVHGRRSLHSQLKYRLEALCLLLQPARSLPPVWCLQLPVCGGLSFRQQDIDCGRRRESGDLQPQQPRSNQLPLPRSTMEALDLQLANAKARSERAVFLGFEAELRKLGFSPVEVSVHSREWKCTRWERMAAPSLFNIARVSFPGFP